MISTNTKTTMFPTRVTQRNMKFNYRTESCFSLTQTTHERCSAAQLFCTAQRRQNNAQHCTMNGSETHQSKKRAACAPHIPFSGKIKPIQNTRSTYHKSSLPTECNKHTPRARYMDAHQCHVPRSMCHRKDNNRQLHCCCSEHNSCRANIVFCS